MASPIVRIILEAVNRASDDFKAINKDATKMGKTLDDVEKKTKKHAKGVKDLHKAYMATAIGVAGAGVAIKKAFDFAKAGVAIKQTQESFESLMHRVDLGVDTLGDMKEATRGTVDEMTMMKSVMTLVAGATGQTEKALTAVMPQLAKIAKAANKLNPTLGTTAFQMESLATAAKRQSIMIADNAGLIIKMDSAVQEVHPSLQMLTNDYKELTDQQRFLNEMLWQGDNLIEQVGGTVDATTDNIAQMETALKDLGDTAKAASAGPISDFAGGLAEAINVTDMQASAIKELTDALDKNIINYEQYRKLVSEVNLVSEDSKKGFQITKMAQEDVAEAIASVNLQLDQYLTTWILFGEAVPPTNKLQDFGEAAVDAANETGVFSDALQGVVDAWTNVSSLSSLESKIKGLFAEIEYKELGLEDIEVGLGMVDASAVGTDLEKEMTIKGAAAMLAIENKAGLIEWDEAAQKLEDAFGLSGEGAVEQLKNALSAAEYLIYVTAIIESAEAGGAKGRKGGGGDQPPPGSDPTMDYYAPAGTYTTTTEPSASYPGSQDQYAPTVESSGEGDTNYNYNFDVTVNIEGGDPNEIIAVLNEQARYAKISGQAYSGH